MAIGKSWLVNYGQAAPLSGKEMMMDTRMKMQVEQTTASSAADNVCVDLRSLLDRTAALAARIESVTEPYSVSRPIPNQAGSIGVEQRLFSPYFDELRTCIHEINAQLDRITIRIDSLDL